jgi:serine/threonine-protein kinase
MAAPDEPTAETEDAGRLPGGVERRIGPYRLLRELGHGGMGVVHLAARADDEYQRRVAIKVVATGIDSEEVIRHFRRERQILAALDHPNIARLVDGGTTEDGRPYIVMDYIEGEPVDRHCDRHQMTVAQRVELFLAVCAAVSHAHRNLVVHRDLKPANIIVTGDGTPRLLDFGIAKLLNPELAGEAGAPTRMALTPAYASPEQVRGEPITTASDVYSLGVVLYELLTGHRPYRVKEPGAAALYRAVLDDDPERPSTAVTRTERASDAASTATEITPERVSRSRGATVERLRRRLRGDLDNILLRALRKEPRQRYPSVEAFADDLRRYLEGRPVRARKPTLAYRAGKFLRRNWLSASAAALLLVVVTGFGVVTAVQARRLRQERDRASRVTAFLVDLFTVADPDEARGTTITAREVLDTGAEKIGRELQDQPDLRAELLATMARVYAGLGLHARSAGLREEVLRLRRATRGPGYPEEPADLNGLASALFDQGRFAEAEVRAREALALGRRRLGAVQAEVGRSLGTLAWAVSGQGRYAEAEALAREAVALFRKLGDHGRADLADALRNLGAALMEQGRYGEGADALEESLTLRRALLGPTHPKVVASLGALAVARYSQGRYAEAAAALQETLAAQRTLYEPTHPRLASTLNNLGGTLFRLQDYAGAERAYREAAEIRRRQPGGVHPNLAIPLGNLGEALEYQGKLADAERSYREALEIRRQTLGPTHRDVAFALSSLSRCLQRTGRFAEAERLSSEGLSIAARSLPPDHPDLPGQRSVLGGALVGLRRFAEAEPLLVESHAALSAQPGKDIEVRETLRTLVKLYESWGRPAEAARYRSQLEAEGGTTRK